MRHPPAKSAVIALSEARHLASRAYHRGRVVRGRLRGGRDWRGVRILAYHRIADERDVSCVTPAAFEAQMRAVARMDAEPIRLDAALDLLDRPVTSRYIAVTFDDGYHDNLTAALPVLERHGIPATIFVASSIIDGTSTYHWYRDPPRALAWDEIRDLVAGGLVDVQAHTRSHPRLPWVDDARAEDEIAGSKHDIEAQVGYALTSLSYPHGQYGAREVALVRAAGYRAGVTTDNGVNEGGGSPDELRRTFVSGTDGDRDFEARLTGLLDHDDVVQRWLKRRRARPPA